MFKRSVALILCLIMAVSLLASCTVKKKNDEDKGAVINMYLSQEIYDFDPAYALKNEASQAIVSLLFSGLFRIDEDGKVQKDLAEKYTIDEFNNSMVITIREDVFWSDGTYISANDVVFAFKRILNPEFTSEAACLLYDIKNARAVKNATTDYYVDDIGIYPVGEREVEITFEKGFNDYEQFIENLASPALVPLRDDIVTLNEGDWAKKPGTMSCSGPFMLRKVSYDAEDKGLVLERNPYYYRDRAKSDLPLDKTVKPYKIIVDYTKSAEEQYQMFLNGEIFYVGDIAISLRGTIDDVKITDSMSTVSVYLNQNAYVGKNAYTIDKETESDPKERVDEATGIKTITTTYTSYRTYYNNMSQEDYDKLHPKKPYTEITNKDFNKDYTYMGTKTDTEVKVDENGQKVLYISEYREYRYTITEGKGLNAVKIYHVDTPFGVKIFQDAGLRKALSMVIDRDTIAKTVVYAKAANALVPYGVFNTNRKDSFREVGGGIISTSPATVEEAKALIPAEINPADFEIQLTVEANDAVHCIVAESIAESWRALGFRVIVEKVDAEVNDEIGSTGEVSTDIRDNAVIESIYNRTFQATVVDLVAPTVRAFSVLAPFAKEFAGTAMNMDAKDADGNYIYAIEGHITGYNNDEYNALIEQAYAETDKAKQAELLHEAEKMLLEDMPIIPVIFNQDAYVISGELSKVSSSYFANRIFTKTKLKDYEKYLETSAS